MTPSAAHFAASVSRFAGEAPALIQCALQGGGTYGDLFYEYSSRQRLALRQSAARSRVGRSSFRSAGTIDEGVGIRVLARGRSGFAATSDLSDAALATAAAEVALQGRGGPVVPVVRVPAAPPPASFAAPADAPDQITIPEKRALLQEAADAALSYDRVRSVEIGYHDRVRRTLVVTSEGTAVAVVQVHVGLRVDVSLDVGGRRVHAYAVGGTAGGFGHFLHRPASELAREAVERARRTSGARPPRPGPMPLVIAAGWGGVWLHEAVGHLMEIDSARPIAEAGRGITLVDDGTLPGGRGSAPFDDEATPTSRTVLVADGRPQSVLTDRFHAGFADRSVTASQAGRSSGRRGVVQHASPAGPAGAGRASQVSLAPTGNGRRQDYRHEPLPRMTNLILESGTAAPDDLVAAAGEGLFVAAVGRGKLVPGRDRFSFDVLEGYRIEGGRLTAPVCGIRVEGTASTVLAGMRGVGSDLEVDSSRGMCRKNGQIVAVSVGTPTVLIEGMEIAPG